MRVILAFLLSFVLVNVQAYALSGGPPGQAIALNITGTYGGVLVPSTEELVPGTTPSASIGLFSVGVPSEGLAQGVAVIFISGSAFIGNIAAIMDPDSGSLTGVIDATSAYQTVTVSGGTTATFAAFAQGNLKAQATTGNQSAASSGIRLEGEAHVDVFGSVTSEGVPNVSNSEEFTVVGFKQSGSVATPTITFGSTDI